MTWPNLYPTLSAPLPDPKRRVLSLGAGVQSTTLALAASRGDVGPMPDCAIFSDTRWESRKVREHLEWLKGQLRFPLYVVSVGSIRDDTIARSTGKAGRYVSAPWFIKTVVPAGTRIPIRGDDGSVEGWTLTRKDRVVSGMARLQCTAHYKLEPIRAKVRELLGVGPRGRIPADSVEIWVGISTDEIERMKPSRVQFMRNRWPLIEAGMSRRDCIRWMEERQFSAPKSSCVGCPFHTNAMWRDMRDNDPEEWADAVEVDRLLRANGGSGKMRGEEYMHPSLKPLSEAPIDDDDPRQLGFNLDCEGMCGV